MTEGQKEAKALPAWQVPAMEQSGWRYLDLVKSVKYLRGDTNIFNFGEHLGLYTREEGAIDTSKLPEVWQSGGVSYTRDELKATFDKIGSSVTRDDYLKAQRHNWKGFFIPPALFVLVWVFLFMVLGKQPAEVPAEPAKDEPCSGRAYGAGCMCLASCAAIWAAVCLTFFSKSLPAMTYRAAAP